MKMPCHLVLQLSSSKHLKTNKNNKKKNSSHAQVIPENNNKKNSQLILYS